MSIFSFSSPTALDNKHGTTVALSWLYERAGDTRKSYICPCSLCSTENMPGPLGTLHKSSYLILTTLWDRYYDYPHFTDWEVRLREVTSQRQGIVELGLWPGLSEPWAWALYYMMLSPDSGGQGGSSKEHRRMLTSKSYGQEFMIVVTLWVEGDDGWEGE